MGPLARHAPSHERPDVMEKVFNDLSPCHLWVVGAPSFKLSLRVALERACIRIRLPAQCLSALLGLQPHCRANAAPISSPSQLHAGWGGFVRGWLFGWGGGKQVGAFPRGSSGPNTPLVMCRLGQQRGSLGRPTSRNAASPLLNQTTSTQLPGCWPECWQGEPSS